MAQKYNLVFKKLADLEKETAESNVQSLPTRTEIDEIAELRRVVLEVNEPEIRTYSAT
jgi:hypothetical protein